MPWGALNSAHQVMVVLSMRGGPQYAAQARMAAAQTGALGSAVLKTSTNMQTASKRTWAYSQFLFTARRYAFYATLAVSALAVGVAKLGFSYLNAMQTARVALRPAFGSTQALTDEINKLYILAAKSPFLFKDTLVAFRTMYPAFRAGGLSVALTNQTLTAAIDALSEAGKTSPAAINRISVQLQHMANIGRPTGQVLLALARDGLPVYPALRKELHLTGMSLANMAHQGLTAGQVIRAINRYIETSPLYRGAAMRQANQTLSGSWAQFKDILSQAAGRGEGGLFGGLHRALFDINKQLVPMMNNNRPITLYNVADAMDHALSPNTHAIINTFITLDTILRVIIGDFALLFKTIQILLWPFDKLGSLFGANRLGARLLGLALGTLIFFFLLYKLAVIGATIATGAFEIAVLGLIGLTKTAAFFLRVLAFVFKFDYEAAVLRAMYATDALREAILFLELQALGLWTVLLANPIIFIIAAVLALTVGLVILYFRWKRFHDLVNRTAAFLQRSWPYVAAAVAVINIPLATMISLLELAIRYWDRLIGLIRKAEAYSRHPLAIPGVTGPNFGPTWTSRPRVPRGNPRNTIFGIDISRFVHPFAAGGMTGGGLSVVGEHGPEIGRFPAGTQIMPMNRRTLQGAGSIQITLHNHVEIDGKEIGHSVATVTTDKQARMSGRT